MKLIQTIAVNETHRILQSAFEAVSEVPVYLACDFYQICESINEDLMDSAISDTCDFYEEFGEVIDGNDVTPEMLEVAGIGVPTLSTDEIRRILNQEYLCFLKDGKVFNHPQVSLKESLRHEKERFGSKFLSGEVKGRSS